MGLLQIAFIPLLISLAWIPHLIPGPVTLSLESTFFMLIFLNMGVLHFLSLDACFLLSNLPACNPLYLTYHRLLWCHVLATCQGICCRHILSIFSDSLNLQDGLWSRGELKGFHCLRSTKCTPGVCRSSYHYGLQLNTTQQIFPRGCQSIWDDKTRSVDGMIHSMGQILTNMKQEIRGSLEDAVSLSSFQRLAPKHRFFYSLFGVVPYGNFC